MIIGYMACHNSKKVNRTLDLQGHRGCRGLLPENTVGGFLKALEIGVTTLEMDLVISKDGEVVVSHEPFFSHEISTDPQKKAIPKEEEKQHNIYQLNYAEIVHYDVGLRPHERFPNKKRVAAVKPLFKDVVKAVEEAVIANGYSKPMYNVEIKRKPENDHLFHPSATEFAKLVVMEVQKTGIKERIVIQSFDPESLRIVKKLDATIGLVLLIENEQSAEENLETLGFVPDIYSPYFPLVNKELVAFCQSKNMQIIPWTVNEPKDMQKMLDLNVDGIITDYPDILHALLKKKQIAIKKF